MKSTILFATVFALVSSSAAFAKMEYKNKFMAFYPDAAAKYGTGMKAQCTICHEKAGPMPTLNLYGKAAKAANFDFKSIESLDSDGDGVKNIDEITQGTYPGDKDSH